MTSFARDDNRIPVWGGTLNTDGQTPVAIAVNPSNKAIKVDDGITGDNYSCENAKRDDNRTPVIWGVSSDDFITPVYIAVDEDGNLLIDSA